MEAKKSLSSPLLPEIRVEDKASESLCTDPSYKFWVESKKLWRVAGPAILNRIASLGLSVISQAFVGHLGDLELAAFSVVISVNVGLSSGLLAGMGNALQTLCGQAFGAQKYEMLGLYLQRSWVVVLGSALLLLPIYIFTTPLLKLLGQPDDVAELSGKIALWCIPMLFSFGLYYTLQKYLECQSKNMITAWSALVALITNILLSWLLGFKLKMGLAGAVFSLNFSWWIPVIGQLLYVVCGGCPLTWTGFQREAFFELWSFFKLSVATGIMICLEIWYYRVLVLMTGNLKDTKVAVDSLSICLNINEWEMAIPLGFLAATGVRVANELGANNGKGAKFAVVVSATSSAVIGFIFWALILVFRSDFASLFTDNSIVRNAVYKLTILLAFTVLLNSIQPVLVGVAVGSGWQTFIAYVNIVCYYIIGVPLGMLLGYVLHLEVMGIWVGMIFGTAIQTMVLTFITWRTDWDREAKNAMR
eukprot:Gb_27609 [translate_table: standard]